MNSPETIQAGVIGFGTIGNELVRQIERHGWQQAFIARSNQVLDGNLKTISEDPYEIDNYPDADIVFLAIPTLDQGETALHYIEGFLDRGQLVVTCEKGALSNNYDRLKPRVNNLGRTATFGGGSGMLPFIQRNMNEGIYRIDGVINGTLNFVTTQVASGVAFDEAVEGAQKLGFAEPLAQSTLDVINDELVGDYPKKTVELLNESLGRQVLRAADIESRPIEAEELEILKKRAWDLRCMVTLEKQDTATKQDIDDSEQIGGFTIEVDGWVVSNGFRRMQSSPLFRTMKPEGVENALMLIGGDKEKPTHKAIRGPGAGAVPTVATMMEDAHRLLTIHR